jgi:hypothetical protein
MTQVGRRVCGAVPCVPTRPDPYLLFCRVCGCCAVPCGPCVPRAMRAVSMDVVRPLLFVLPRVRCRACRAVRAAGVA